MADQPTQRSESVLARHQRSIFHFRRRSDKAVFAVTLGMLVFWISVFVYKLKFEPPPATGEAVGASVPAPEDTERMAAPATAEPPAAAPEPVPTPPPPADEPPAPVEPSPAPKPKAAAPEKKKAPPPPPVKPKPAAAKPAPGIDMIKGGKPFIASAHNTAQVNLSSLADRVEIRYDLRDGEWVQIVKEGDWDLTAHARISFSFKGAGNTNTLELKVVDEDGSTFGHVWHGKTNAGDWFVVNLPVDKLAYMWGGDNVMNWKKTKRIFFAVSKKDKDQGGKGTVTIKNIRFQ